MSFKFGDDKNHDRIAKLDTEEMIKYDVCCEIDTDFKLDHAFDYIGTGTIYTIDGILQSGSRKFKFYQGPKLLEN